jgi:predicted metal-dependent peptidase
MVTTIMEVCMDARKQLAKARAGLVLDQPFFGSLALRLELVEQSDPGWWASQNVPTTMATDGKRIHFYPEFVESMSLEETKGVICHEIMHCANQHHTRRDDREQVRWNMAGDYAINPIILNCGMALPKGCLADQQFGNMSAEEIYGKLPEMPDDPNGQGQGEGGFGSVIDSPSGEGNGPASKDELEHAAQEWKVAVAQAATQAKNMGELPGALERIVEDLLEPVLDWKELLRRFVDTSARNDFAWFPPNRRYVHMGIYLPSLHSQELKNIVMAMDTSGSISNDDLKAFASEVRAIVQDFRANTKVIYCDAVVQSVEEFDADSPIELHPGGGGGTDFVPPFEHIAEHGDDPVCMIYQTDGYCDSFPDEPPYPVLWVLTRKNEYFNPPFGEVVNL